MNRTIRIVDDAEARRLLNLQGAYDVILNAYHQAATSPPVLSTPSALLMHHASAPQTEMKIKGAQLPKQRASGFRMVGDFYNGHEEISHDFFWLANMDTAQPLGLVEMNTLHAVRTALTGIIALETLCTMPCTSVALLGAGRIADWIIDGLRLRLDPKEIRVVASRPERAAQFAARHGAPVRAVNSVDEAVDGVQAVIAITNAKAPIMHWRHIKPGMTVIGMGGGYECSASVLQADRFIVDDFQFASVMGSMGAWMSAGEIDAETARQRVDGELGEVLAGLKPGRRTQEESVFAIVQGMACCDLALAWEIYNKAAGAGTGQTTSF